MTFGAEPRRTPSNLGDTKGTVQSPRSGLIASTSLLQDCFHLAMLKLAATGYAAATYPDGFGCDAARQEIRPF